MTRREVLEKLYEQAFHEDYHHRHSPRHINQALTELDKLEKEKMLEYVGEDKNQHKEYFTAVAEAFDDGYNQAKAEIRKAVRL